MFCNLALQIQINPMFDAILCLKKCWMALLGHTLCYGLDFYIVAHVIIPHKGSSKEMESKILK